jgi:hypothetical protein
MNFTSPFTVREHTQPTTTLATLLLPLVRKQQPEPNPKPMHWVILVVVAVKQLLVAVKRDFGQADSESTTSTGTNVALVYLPSGLSGCEQESLTSMRGLLETVG